MKEKQVPDSSHRPQMLGWSRDLLRFTVTVQGLTAWALDHRYIGCSTQAATRGCDRTVAANFSTPLLTALRVRPSSEVFVVTRSILNCFLYAYMHTALPKSEVRRLFLIRPGDVTTSDFMNQTPSVSLGVQMIGPAPVSG